MFAGDAVRFNEAVNERFAAQRELAAAQVCPIMRVMLRT
jgi:hypothetical protein